MLIIQLRLKFGCGNGSAFSKSKACLSFLKRLSGEYNRCLVIFPQNRTRGFMVRAESNSIRKLNRNDFYCIRLAAIILTVETVQSMRVQTQ